jgi:hypothetical protein
LLETTSFLVAELLKTLLNNCLIFEIQNFEPKIKTQANDQGYSTTMSTVTPHMKSTKSDVGGTPNKVVSLFNFANL